MRCRAGLRDAIRTAPPVGDLGLVDLVAPVVDRRETRGGADRAVDVDHAAADSTDQMVVIVADPILEASRRSGGLNAPDQSSATSKARASYTDCSEMAPISALTTSATASAVMWG